MIINTCYYPMHNVHIFTAFKSLLIYDNFHMLIYVLKCIFFHKIHIFTSEYTVIINQEQINYIYIQCTL